MLKAATATFPVRFPSPHAWMQWWKKYIFLCPSGNRVRFGCRLVGRPVDGQDHQAAARTTAGQIIFTNYTLTCQLWKGKTNRNRRGAKIISNVREEKSGDILGGKAITSPTDDWVRCRTPTRLTAPIITSNKGRPSSYRQPSRLLRFWPSRFLPVPQSAMFV